MHETANIRDRKRLLRSMLRNDGSEADGDPDHHVAANGNGIFKETDIRYEVTQTSDRASAGTDPFRKKYELQRKQNH